MRKLLATFFIFLSGVLLNAQCVNTSHLVCSHGMQRPVGYMKSLYAPSWCPLGTCNSTIIASRFTPISFQYSHQLWQGNMLTSYAAIPFQHSAVFCRMENHFLTRYSVKFSIHAGEYHEGGSVR